MTSETREADTRLWWRAPKGQVHTAASAAVRRMEEAQGDIFDRFVKLEVLYDPNTPLARDGDDAVAHISENMIASNVDTIAASISTTDVLPRVETDGADWDMQRRARELEWYAEEQMLTLDVMPRCRSAFKEGAKKGNGLTKVSERFGKPVVELALIENIVVDPTECRDGRAPKQMHEWVTCDADELIARFPKFEKEIDRARASGWRKGWRSAAYLTSLLGASNDVTYLESFRLPIGEEGMKGYRPGRHTIVIDGQDLLDEKWTDELFPYADIVWSERVTSYYGIGGGERVAGLQRALNKANWTLEKAQEFMALPTTYVRPADANLTVRSSRAGGVAVCYGDYPQTVTPPAVPPEAFQHRMRLRDSGGQEFGQSSMATHAAKPAGLDSAVAMREFRDQSSQRYALQEKGFEDLVLKTVRLVLWVCKKLGAKAPKMIRHSRFGSRTIVWKDVDMDVLKIQMKAASNLNRTPAGRQQMVVELAQAGIISQDSARRLMSHPDLEAELSLYTAALECVEKSIDDIAEGHNVVPEPYMNLEMCVWRGQAEYNKWVTAPKCPEERLESLRQFIVQAAAIVAMKNAPANNNMGALPSADASAGAMPPGADVGAMPALPGGPPANAPAIAAFAPQAMQLRSGTG